MSDKPGICRVTDWIRQALDAGTLKASVGGGGVAFASGVFGWFATNHSAISAMVGIGGLAIGIAGLVFERRAKRARQEADRRQELRDIEYHLKRMARMEHEMERRDDD